MPPVALIDPLQIDTSKVLYDLEAIRRFNRQRYEMEQLTAVLWVDTEANLIVGYKDIAPDEFWVRGHMPDFPLMPGVLMCEAAAQLCSVFCQHIGLVRGSFLGFGGMEAVRFRGMVKPGDRLIIAAHPTRLNRRQTIFDTQGFVGEQMVFQAQVIGVPLGANGDSEGPG
jgi:3-hydroxyacyl-[acyl-carrier-protein] dehydratase